MTPKPPRTPSDLLRIATGATDLETEILAEKAAALGRAGVRVERALADLAAAGAEDPGRPALVLGAAQALHALFIQRELSGFRSHADLVRRLDVPKEVLAKVGVAG